MKKYFFVNFTVVIKANSQKFNHMSVLSTAKNFFPILEAKKKIMAAFDKDIGQATNVIINNFQEVTKESFEEFHKDSKPDFVELQAEIYSKHIPKSTATKTAEYFNYFRINLRKI